MPSILVYPLNQTKKTIGKSENMHLLPKGEAESFPKNQGLAPAAPGCAGEKRGLREAKDRVGSDAQAFGPIKGDG